MDKETLTSILIVLSIVMAFFVGFYSSESTEGTLKDKFLSREIPIFITEGDNISTRSLKIPAVSEEGKGITGQLTVIIKDGSGMINIDVSNLLINDNTESSLRKAAIYAFEQAGKNLNNHEVTYHIETNSPAIKGSSAGASAAITTIAALENKTIDESVMMTGTIHHDGDIGPADGIIPKAKAAERINKTLFLVPRTQSQERNITNEEYCAEYGGNEICSNEYSSEIVNVGEESGIKVKEVKNITEALKYFF